MEQTRKYNKDLDKDLCKAEPSITIQIIKKDDFFSNLEKEHGQAKTGKTKQSRYKQDS